MVGKIVPRYFRLGVVLLLQFLLFTGMVQAQSSGPYDETRSRSVEVMQSRYGLSDGRADWTRTEVGLTKRFDSERQVYLRAGRVERFNRRDADFRIGAYAPIVEHWEGHLEVQWTPSPDVLPGYGLRGRLYYSLESNLRPYAGFSVRDYSSNHVRTGSLGVEYYYDLFRLAYTFSNGTGKSDRSTGSHQFQFGVYANGGSSLAFSYSGGEEIDFVGAGRTVRSDVSYLIVNGLYRVNPDWALLFEVMHHDQGDFYTREGGRIGARYRF